MAYAALVSLAQLLDRIRDRNQNCPAHGQPCIARGQRCIVLRLKQKIQSLHEEIVFLLTFLEDFPRETGNLEARITTVANHAEDTLEYHILNTGGPKYGKRSYTVFDRFWQDILYPEISSSADYNLDIELTEALKEITAISKKVVQIKSSSASENLMSRFPSGSFASRHAPYGKDTVVGFEEDLMEINGRLCGEPSNLQVIPIVGMGGIGKTTLARYAHDGPLTVQHFDIRAWVTISQNSSINKILLSLVDSMNASTKTRYQSVDNELLVQHGYRYLKGRRYLIVIDDMWTTNVWDDIRRVFPDDWNGSRIIITTRELDVASYVDSSSHPHEVHLMDVDQSWKLLKEKVFAQESCPPQLEQIGKLIAEKCRGLPLAIVVIAGVLSRVNQMQDIWEKVAANVIEAVNTSDEQFSEILSLSYTHLPHHLRPCFLYMGGFPEDHEISISKIIRLWAAEGFLKSNASKDIEEVAEEYIEDLAKRSLVMINKKRYNGKIKTVMIHDLLRDLCLQKARDEKFLHVINEFSGSFPDGRENLRRLSTFSHTSRRFPRAVGSSVHTVLLFHRWAFACWENFRLLRVVDALSLAFTSYPDEISELFHLRYLAITFEPEDKFVDFEVPEPLSKLQNLQTLIIAGPVYGGTSYLPFGIWRMPELRHLILLDGSLPDPSADSCGQILALENLHTLTRIESFTCSERILELIPNLKKLGIIYWTSDIYKKGWSEFGLNNLFRLHKLEKLNFHAHPHDYSRSSLSKNLAFPVMLKKLTLSGSAIPWKEMSIVGSLPNLEVLKLKRHACHGFEWETSEGEFCRLKTLLIDSTDPHHWITESSHFPRLERLLLYNCHSLKGIPYSIGEISTLQLIEVDCCDSSVVESAKFIEKEQHSFGNDLQVHIETSSERVPSNCEGR